MKTRLVIALMMLVLFLVACPQPVTPGPDASDSGGQPTADASMPQLEDSAVAIVDATPPPPPVDAGLGSVACLEACANLRRLGCPEGSEDAGAGCSSICNHTVATNAFTLNPICIASAKDVAGVRACGTVKCPSIAKKP
jgi:hypothetical protein